jgi:hypothetical protein
MKLSCRQKVPCVLRRCRIEWDAIARLQSFRIKSFETDHGQATVNVPEMFDQPRDAVAHETVNPLTR